MNDIPDPNDVIKRIEARYGEDLADSIHSAMMLMLDPNRPDGTVEWDHGDFVAAAMYSLPTEDLENIMANIKNVRRLANNH